MVTEEEKDKLVILQERFESEGKNGDLSEAARMAKVSAPNASTGLARNKWNDLKKAERKTLIQLYKILNERKDEELETVGAIQ